MTFAAYTGSGVPIIRHDELAKVVRTLAGDARVEYRRNGSTHVRHRGQTVIVRVDVQGHGVRVQTCRDGRLSDVLPGWAVALHAALRAWCASRTTTWTRAPEGERKGGAAGIKSGRMAV